MGTPTVRGAVLAIVTLLLARGAIRAQEPRPPKAAGEAVGRFAERLKAHPVIRPNSTYQHRLFLVEAAGGTARPIVDEPEQGLTYCGSAWWSSDGRRILFDCTPLTLWQLSKIKALELGDGPPKLVDLGMGNCPSTSPDGRRIAFLSNEEGKETGVYVMKADGSERALLGSYGRPKWSPDGRAILISSFSNPCDLSVMDVKTRATRTVGLAGSKIFTIPSWAGPDTVVASVGAEAADSVVLIDVSDPENAKVKEVLWKKATGPDVVPNDVVYHPGTRRCVFVGATPKGMALYTLAAGDPAPPKRVEPEGLDHFMGDLALSPDGRFVVFHSDQFDRPAR